MSMREMSLLNTKITIKIRLPPQRKIYNTRRRARMLREREEKERMAAAAAEAEKHLVAVDKGKKRRHEEMSNEDSPAGPVQAENASNEAAASVAKRQKIEVPVYQVMTPEEQTAHYRKYAKKWRKRARKQERAEEEARVAWEELMADNEEYQELRQELAELLALQEAQKPPPVQLVIERGDVWRWGWFGDGWEGNGWDEDEEEEDEEEEAEEECKW